MRHAIPVSLPFPFPPERVKLRYLRLVPYRITGCSHLILRYASSSQHTPADRQDDTIPSLGIKSKSTAASDGKTNRENNENDDSTLSSASLLLLTDMSGGSSERQSSASRLAGMTISSAQSGTWRSTLDKHRRQLEAGAERQLTMLGKRINELTGYKEVERLKDVVHKRGRLVPPLPRRH